MDIIHQFFACAKMGDARIRFLNLFVKFIKENERTLMSFPVELHHSLMDGLHVGLYIAYIARIEKMLAQPEVHLD